jgi:uncharacterized membrane protein
MPMTRLLRENLARAGAGKTRGFRWRGGEVSRIEGFTDAVFAFAVTLLVVSLEVPRTFSELLHVMRGFFAFGICFAVLIAIWHEHYVFFRRYGLQDARTIWLNAALLFVVLFYIYPLKFLFSLVIDRMILRTPLPAEEAATSGEARTLFLVYGAGVIAVFGMLALLYAHALRRREDLELDRTEIFHTRASIGRNLLGASVGVVSILVALLVPDRMIGLAGYAYFLFGIAFGIHGALAGRRLRKIEAARDRASSSAPRVSPEAALPTTEA